MWDNISSEELTRRCSDFSVCQTMNGAALVDDRSGVTFNVELCIPWEPWQRAHITMIYISHHVITHPSVASAFIAYRALATRCNRLICPLARMSGLQYFNMGHNGHGINLYGVSMTLMGN